MWIFSMHCVWMNDFILSHTRVHILFLGKMKYRKWNVLHCFTLEIWVVWIQFYSYETMGDMSFGCMKNEMKGQSFQHSIHMAWALKSQFLILVYIWLMLQEKKRTSLLLPPTSHKTNKWEKEHHTQIFILTNFWKLCNVFWIYYKWLGSKR